MAPYENGTTENETDQRSTENESDINGNRTSIHDRMNNRKAVPLSVKELDEKTGDITDYVHLEQLPEFQIINQRVMAVVASSSLWERYGKDLALLLGAVIGLYASYFLLASRDGLVFAAGVIIMGLSYSHLSIKAGHCALHGSLTPSKNWDKIIGFFCLDFIGTFSYDVGWDIHIRSHHPHTNIIGLGDSSTWKAPFVPNFLYMFVTPLLTPILLLLVALKGIMSMSFVKILRHFVIAYGGLLIHLYLLTSVSGFSLSMSLLVTFLSRNILAIPYIHVNIFQHIGLPMYSQKHRPKKVYQMTSGVLNLPRNPVLEFGFGHGIISAHVEHHLFPKLSDNMCFKIKPVVEAFCKEYKLQYNKDTYLNRTKTFLYDYQNLMVNVPPITKFVGIQ